MAAIGKTLMPAAVVVSALAVTGTTAFSQSGALFERLAGSWSGGGTVNVANAMSEPVRCRATYAPSGSTRLRFTLACASDSFKIQASSELIRQGNHLDGSWSETTFGASGNVSGTVSADHITATVYGQQFRADLSLSLRGGVQSVTLTSQGQIAGSATVTLRRG